MQSLLATLSALKINIEVSEGRLRVHAPAGVLTPELQQEISRHKDALIAKLTISRSAAPQEEELPRIVPDAASRYEPFPLNDVQHAYWIGRSSHLELGDVSSHIYFEFEGGDLDPDRLSAAFRKVVALHGMLRAVIDVNGRQRVLETVPDYEIAVCDLRCASPRQRDEEMERVRAEMSHQMFDSGTWPLFEVRLIRTGEGSSRLCVSLDFLVLDAWSMLILFKQWYGFYESPALAVPAPDLSFRDYVLAEASLKELPSYQASKSYWWDRLDDLPPAPQLPLVSRIEKGRTHRFTRRRFRLPAESWEALKTRARQSGLTLASLLLAAFAEVLDRWVKNPHYCLNLTLFNRLPLHEDVGAIVGDFTNLLVLEVDGRSGGSFLERAARLQAQFLRDFEHRRVSAVEVLRELVRRRGWQQRAVLPVVFTSTLMMDGRRSEDAGAWERFGTLGYGITQTPQAYLDYQIFEVSGDLVINWDAVEEVFLPGVLDDMLAAQKALLEALATDPEVWERDRVVALPPGQRERQAVVNATDAEVVDRCLHDLFVEAALRSPDRTALVSNGTEMSYGDLLAHSHRVAEGLLARGVEPNQLVAVVLPKGWEQAAAVLGVLMAGAAYLPIDPRWPALRRNQLLVQGEARIALTRSASGEEAEWPADVERIAIQACPGLPRLTAAPPLRQTATDLAYVIFTSGSTGTPKGVMIDHRSAVNTVVHMNRLFSVGEGDKVLAVSDLTFDLSVYDVFGLLAAGGTVVLPDAERARDPGHWEDLIRRWSISVWNSAPPLMGVLADAMEAAPVRGLSSLRLVLLSGDWIPVQLPDRVRRMAPGARVISLGGATEGSIWSIYYPVEKVGRDWESIPYGKALPNQHMYVLDKRLEPCPELVTGDIYIGGAGVALGYWKDPERTARQFIRHPATGERLYFTGDLGRLLRDGNIEFLGREDSQVKLRGYRVELGEITACLQSHPGVRDATVQLLKHEGRSSLAAYVVSGGAESHRLFEQTAASAPRLQQVSRHVEAAGGARTRETDRAGLRTFAAFWRQVERASLRAMLETLDSLGVTGGADVSAQLDRLVAAGRVKPHFRRLVPRWLRVLAGGGHLLPAAGSAADEPLERQLAEIERTFGSDERIKGFLVHAAGCLRNHLGLFSGAVAPLDLLFPEGSWHLAEGLYERSPIARHHNAVAAAVVRSLVGGWEGDRRLQVLELGAGTGGTTGALLAELPAARTDYWYTDLSSYFLSGAKEKFARYPFVHYAIFDVDKAPAAQGHQPHSYDLIVAANVLHNATDVNATLGRVRELLRPGGYLLMLEGTRTSPWQWATISFLEAVTAYADERAGQDVPLLTAEGWRSALARCGFEGVHAFPAPAAAEDGELAADLDAMPQHVIAAQGPASVSRFKPEELAAFLGDRLQGHMVPQRFFLLEKLPLTANGKIDLAALPRDIAAGPQGSAQERRVAVPRSEAEERILGIWKEVLGVERLGISDNFFEVGGDSLLMTAVLRKINQSRQTPLTTAELFSYPTVQSLAEHLSGGAKPGKVQPAAAVEGPRERGPRAAAHDIAVIGLAGRFPDARNVEELWQNLSAGRCAVRTFSDEELLQSGVAPAELAQANYVKAGVVLEGMQLFDAPFFGFTPREAEVMDPQQRFLLECAVEALDAAGYPGERYAGRVGVFVGKGTSLYLLEHVLRRPDLIEKLGLMSLLYVNEKDFAATLVSYKLNLTGPSVNVNTGCSTSLVAVHSACQSLLNGECEIALAGGVSFVSTLERSGYLYHEGQIASATGLCRAFSDDADGAVFGHGAGLVVLKPLAAALRDRDTIHAVIKGSAINNDGMLKVGYSAPSLQGQAKVLAEAQARAGLAPDSIQLVEAHGTGTNLGDPIELGALRQVFGGPRADGSRCALGSVKSNVGHLDSAAGVAGLIKVVEALKHRQIPPTLHVSVPTRKMDFADSPFYLSTELADWPAGPEPRRAGVSSFGVGGTNAHVIVEEAPSLAERMVRPAAGAPQLLPLSAKSRGSLKEAAQALAGHLGRHPELSLEDVAFTLQAGRNAYAYRGYLMCDSLTEAQSRLAGEGLPRVAGRSSGQTTPAVAFLFPGQGAQRRGVTRELYQEQPAFRSELDRCAEIVRQYTDRDIRDWLYAETADLDVDQTEIAQPLLFAVEYALARFWESLGVRPVAMVGHSLGEYVAACLAGVFSLEEALSLVVVRGQLMQSLEPGRMMAVSCGEERLLAFLEGSKCSLAAVNGPEQCVASGAAGDLDALQRRLEAAEILCRSLRISHAFHSSMVEPVLDVFEQCVAEVDRRPPSIPFLSNLSGTWIEDGQATSPAYWARHLREAVRFADSAQELLKLSGTVLLEVGPGHSLSTLMKASGAPLQRTVPTFGYDTGAHGGEVRAVLDALGQLWQQGIDIDWTGLHAGRQPGRVPLPAYSFERKRYWIERGGLGREAGPAPAADGAEPEAAVLEEAWDDLAGHARPELHTAYVPPGNEIEVKLAAIWQSYLGIENVGIRDNFFELGGDSLLAARVYAQIKKALDVELPVDKMFELSTIRRISLFIATSSDAAAIDSLSADELDELLAVMEP
jgi:amino acid adenylation domain-containing protein